MGLNVVLHEPEIPQNTGNIVRTCAALGAKLHLIKPLGFSIDERAVRRAGLDYWHHLEIATYDSLRDFFEKTGSGAAAKIWFLSTKAPRSYCEADFEEDCYLVFGKESRGLPENLLLENFRRCVRIPMREGIRSLNLSNSVAILAYEWARQRNFAGLRLAGSMDETSLVNLNEKEGS